MQFHFDGFRTGDPNVAPASQKARNQREVDVLIVGCGPAGLTLAAQLAEFPDINTRIIDQKDGPLEVGQADGIACRSMEMFEAFGFADDVKRESYWVNEVAFWRPANDANGELTRVERIQDVEDDLSEMPHTILSQARIHDFFLKKMRQSSAHLQPDYDIRFVDYERDDSHEYPIQARLQHSNGDFEYTRAKYLVGCDGARSQVREALGLSLKGSSASQLWGVMDVLAVTDFPDIRLKAAVQSSNAGSLLIIPREGGFMVRLYIELDELLPGERVADRQLTSDILVTKAQAILSPYVLDVKEIAWWSAYEVGQRLADRFDDVDEHQMIEPRVFICGDACHTHSPKAGQGMNVSMADAFNLGWKLAWAIRDSRMEHLLKTYSIERHAIAKELIDFDKDMARLFSEKTKDSEKKEQFQRYFQKHGRYTAGVETHYKPSLLTYRSPDESKLPELVSGLVSGMRFHSAPVIRVADAKPVQLGHAMKADGLWRLVAFAANGDIGATGGTIAKLCDYLQQHERSPMNVHADNWQFKNQFVEFLAVFQQHHHELALDSMPALLLPEKGALQLIDYERIFCACQNSDENIFIKRGINQDTGALIIVRPDQYISRVLPLEAYNELADFFSRLIRTDERI